MQQGTESKDACIRQRVIQGFERIHVGGEWNFSASAATSAPTERHRESNTNLQEPFHFRNGVNTQGFPPPFLVPSIASSHRHIKPYPSVHNKPHPLSTCSTPWTIRFQCNSICTTGNKSNISSKANNQKCWAPRGKDGWYIDQAKNHYRYYNIYVPETRSVIHPDTVEFLSHNSNMPFWSSA